MLFFVLYIAISTNVHAQEQTARRYTVDISGGGSLTSLLKDNLEISRRQGSDSVAIAFSIKFAEHWPAVLSDLEDGFFEIADLRRLQAARTGLP